MQYVQLGRAGVKVSRLCLGTMNFGSETPAEESLAIMSKALDEGVNFFDTANSYGWKGRICETEQINGVSESLIGRWFKEDPSRREKMVIATKVYSWMHGGPNGMGLSSYSIRQNCDASLLRLRTDHIDLYQMHHIDRRCSWEEIWEAFETLIRQGKVLYIGSSNFAGWDIASACLTAKERKLLGPVSEQSRYSLDVRTIELEVIPACRHYGLGVIPWSPLSFGLLGGVLQKLHEGRRTAKGTQERAAKLRPQLERYEALCAKLNLQPAQVALAWILHNPVVTAPIIGPRTMEQFASVLGAAEIKLDEATLKELDAIWPGPGGEAPKAYAW